MLIFWSRRIGARCLSLVKSIFVTLLKEVGIFKLLEEARFFKLCTYALCKVLGALVCHAPCALVIFCPKSIGAPFFVMVHLCSFFGNSRPVILYGEGAPVHIFGVATLMFHDPCELVFLWQKKTLVFPFWCKCTDAHYWWIHTNASFLVKVHQCLVLICGEVIFF